MSPRASRRAVTRRWVGWLAGCAVAGTLILLLEGLCRLAGWGLPDPTADPFVGFAGVSPLFVRNEPVGRWQIAPARLSYFSPDSFPIEKQRGVFRIFCLGGSTVKGRPFARETAFPMFLQLGLQAAEPKTRWEVVNVGGVSYASYRLAPVLEECLRHEPDLIILTTGHNEFLEDRSYPDLKEKAARLARWQAMGGRSRLVTALRELKARMGPGEAESKPVLLAEEVDALLDYRGGLEAYHRDPVWQKDIVQHFEFNLSRMAARCREAGVPLILVKPCSNLKDCPPFKAEAGDGLDPEQLWDWRQAMEQGQSLMLRDPGRAAEFFKRAVRIDPDNAFSHYQLGRAQLGAERFDAARQSFLRSRDEDVCPLRMISALERRLESVAREWALPLLDVQELFEAGSPDGILGNGPLVDHVHPGIEGHQAMADALLRLMVTHGLGGFLHLPETAELKSIFAEHVAALPPAYFEDAAITLEGLQAWTQGRASGPPLLARRFQPPQSRAPKPPASPDPSSEPESFEP